MNNEYIPVTGRNNHGLKPNAFKVVLKARNVAENRLFFFETRMDLFLWISEAASLLHKMQLIWIKFLFDKGVLLIT